MEEDVISTELKRPLFAALGYEDDAARAACVNLYYDREGNNLLVSLRYGVNFNAPGRGDNFVIYRGQIYAIEWID